MGLHKQHAPALSGAAFVVALLVGNSLSMAGTSHAARPSAEQVVADLAVQASATVNQVGLAVELLGFAAFAVFLAHTAQRLGRGGPLGAPGVLALVAGTVLLAVKLGSAAPYLFALADHERLPAGVALALVGVNGLAFVVAWLPLALFVAAAAVALHRAGLVGRLSLWSGLVIGVAGVPVAAVTALNPYSEFAGTFLLSLLWIAAVSVRLAVGQRPAPVSLPVQSPLVA